MAKIAVGLHEALAERARMGSAARLDGRLLARGDGWTVEDVLCTSGPNDRTFAEQHAYHRIVVVTAGSFEYRSDRGRELMTPGSLLLGNPSQPFECRHDHGRGDRCLSFGYTPELFERLGVGNFTRLRVPPLRALSRLVADACAAVVNGGAETAMWEEIGLRLVAQTIETTERRGAQPNEPPPSAIARVTRAVRLIEHEPAASLTLETLSDAAGLSPFHFLRVFERLTGETPHQYVRRARLRDAAVRLAGGHERVLDIALECGFEDISTFNRAFRVEFGVTPRAYRMQRLLVD